MSTNHICYYTEDVTFELSDPEVTTAWIKGVIQQEGHQLIQLNFIFCSDKYLHAKNVQYLQHDTLTDVITFDYSEKAKDIEGDIYISIERVQENAIAYQCTFWQELYRVMIHGVLHLLGYDDKLAGQQQDIRKKENLYVFARLSSTLQ